MEQTISGESDIQTIFETLLTTFSPLQTNPLSCFLKPPALLGVTISGRGRLAPSGGWPRAGRASKGPPKEVPLPWPVPWEIPWEPVEGLKGVRKCPMSM